MSIQRILLFFVLFVFGIACLCAQDQPPALPPPNQALSPGQLNDLVAPIALYPDPLLSQIMVASTYPLEVVQAYQWLQRNPGLNGPDLTQAAQQGELGSQHPGPGDVPRRPEAVE